MLDHSDYNNDQTEADNQALAVWPEFTEVLIMQTLGRKPDYSFRRCTDHGLYAYKASECASACPRKSCNARTVAIPDIAAFATHHKVHI